MQARIERLEAQAAVGTGEPMSVLWYSVYPGEDEEQVRAAALAKREAAGRPWWPAQWQRVKELVVVYPEGFVREDGPDGE